MLKVSQLLAVGRWFPPGTPVSSTGKLISSSSFHRLEMTLAVAEANNPIIQSALGILTHLLSVYPLAAADRFTCVWCLTW